jgi:hypothetical protein
MKIISGLKQYKVEGQQNADNRQSDSGDVEHPEEYQIA